MDYKELVEALKEMLPEKIPYGELVGAEGAFAHSGPLVYEDPEPYFIEQAATAITELLEEVEKLKAERDSARHNLRTVQKMVQEYQDELIPGYRERAEKAEAQRDAAIKELDEVAAAVDDLSDFIDEQIHPLVPYNFYTSLRENADAISMWQYEEEWRGQKEE